MKTIKTEGNPESIGAMMVSKDGVEYQEHETVRLESEDTNESVEKKIFRIVDAGDQGWELQFE